MSRWKLGSMVRINGLFHLLIYGIYWGYNPLPNLLLTSWDNQVVSGWFHCKISANQIWSSLQVVIKSGRHASIYNLDKGLTKLGSYEYFTWSVGPEMLTSCLVHSWPTPHCLWQTTVFSGALSLQFAYMDTFHSYNCKIGNLMIHVQQLRHPFISFRIPS